MYKILIDGVPIFWNAEEKNLGIEMVKKVTKGRKADSDGYVEVSQEERDEIINLYSKEMEKLHPTPKEDEKKNEVSKDEAMSLSLALAENYEKQEKDKLELMAAIAEGFEILAGGQK